MPEPSDWILLTGLSFPCVIGLPDSERLHPQRLDVEIGLSLSLDGAAAGDLSASVDYVRVLEQVQFVAQHGRWRLLESLGSALAAHLLRRPAAEEGRAAIAATRVRLAKPEVFAGQAVPAIELHRKSQWLQDRAQLREAGGVRAFVLQESRETGAYHLDLAAASGWTVPPGMQVMVISGSVECAGHPRVSGEQLPPGSRLAAGSTAGARLLAVSLPPIASAS